MSGKENCIYWGLFIDDGELPAGSLARDIPRKHVTFGFRKPYPSRLIGTRWDVEITGYGNDGVNEGVSVSMPDPLYELFDGMSEPHVTLSVSDVGRPADTGRLGFDGAWNGKRTVSGTFGYFGFDEGYHFEAPGGRD